MLAYLIYIFKSTPKPQNYEYKAFSKFGIDASFNEKTAETDFRRKIDNWNKLPNKEDVARELVKLNKKNVDEFLNTLSKTVSRFIERITILPLHGQEAVSTSVTEAIDFLNKYSEGKPKLPLSRYEIIIKYNTGDKIEASFKDRSDSIKFLETYR